MRLFVVLSLLSVVIICSSAVIDKKVQVESFYNELSEDSYKFGYEV